MSRKTSQPRSSLPSTSALRGPVEVAVDLGKLEELACDDHALERGAVDEVVVDTVPLRRTWRPGGVRDREVSLAPLRRELLHDPSDQRGLAAPRRRRNDEELAPGRTHTHLRRHDDTRPRPLADRSRPGRLWRWPRPAASCATTSATGHSRCCWRRSRALPLPVLRGLGRLAGRAALPLARRDRGRALAHIARAFPEHDDAWRQALARRCAGHLGTVLGEVAWLWSASPEAILARSEFDGLEHLTGSLRPDARRDPRHRPLRQLGVAQPRPRRLRSSDDGRRPRGLRPPPRRGRPPPARPLRRRDRPAGEGRRSEARAGHSRNGRVDRPAHRPGHRRSRGCSSSSSAGPPGRPPAPPCWRCAPAARSSPGSPRACADGRMRLSFSEPIQIAPGAGLDTDVARLTAILTAHIERQVRSHPEQWVWMHRRWRHQPGEGETVWRVDRDGPDAAPVPAPGSRMG